MGKVRTTLFTAGEKIALDSMIFIYLFEDDERYIKYIYPLFKQAELHKISLVTSIISVIETLSPVRYITDQYTRTEVLQFFQDSEWLTVHFIDWEIATEAARLRRENKYLRVPDSIQLATALKIQATAFITNDIKLAKLSFPQLQIRRLS